MGKINLEIGEINQFGGNEFFARGGTGEFFFGDIYPNFTKVEWKSREDQIKIDVYNSLIDFYNELENGSYNKAEALAFPFGLRIRDRKNSKDFPMEYLINGGVIENIPEFENFFSLGIISPYAMSWMESYKGPWISGKGMVGVTTHQDFSTPVARLIEKTSDNSVGVEKILKMIYTFRR